MGRVIGPTVGGFIVAAIASWAVFYINSASFIGMIIVLCLGSSILPLCKCDLPSSSFLFFSLFHVDSGNPTIFLNILPVPGPKPA
jgi:hypothetical protein